MITVGILETGEPPAGLVGEHGRYDAMIRRMIGPGLATQTYDVQTGELPADPGDHHAYVITGSAAGVYDPLPWIGPLKGFIRAAHGRARLVGLCFGHQVMAEALGGRVEKSGKGWGLGLHRYGLTPGTPWASEGAEQVAVPAMHQDQVVAAPPGARLLASSAFTPFAALAYAGGPSLSVQFHPEFTNAFAAALVEVRSPFILGADVAGALASLAAPSDAARVGGWLRQALLPAEPP